MEANELRIGNLLKTASGRITHVTKIFIDKGGFSENSSYLCFNYNETEVEPIELTKEWLLNFGFKKQDLVPSPYVSYYVSPSVSYSNNEMDVYIQDGIVWYELNADSIEIKYVHQIQNLYFAITGHELNLTT